MPPTLVDDELWELIQPLLPRKTRRYRHPGRRRIDDRKALNGILFVLTTGIAWQRLPRELGFGSGMTCWRRLRDWQQAGVWQQLHELLLARLRNPASRCLLVLAPEFRPDALCLPQHPKVRRTQPA